MNLTDKINLLQADWHHATRQVQEEHINLKAAKRRFVDCQEARSLIQAVAQKVQQTAHRRMAKVVSRCLKTVYGPAAYAFKIEFKQARGKTEARLLFVRDGHELSPLKETSGGQAQLAAFALRLAGLLMANPPRRWLLVLDEPFSGVDQQRRPALRQLLIELTRELGIQIILTTHDQAFQAGKVVRLGDPKGPQTVLNRTRNGDPAEGRG